MKREVKSVSRRSSVSLSHGPFSWWQSDHGVLLKAMAGCRNAEPRECLECLSLKVSRPSGKAVPFTWNLSFHSPSPNAGSSIPVRKLTFSLVVFSKSSTGHHYRIAVTIGVCRCWETPSRLQSLHLAFWAQVLIFQHQ